MKEVFPELKAYEYLDSGVDVEERVKNYFINKYAGTVMMVGMYEEIVKLKPSLTENGVLCQITILGKHDKQKTSELVGLRQRMKTLMMKVLHKIKDDCDETREAVVPNPASGGHWRFELVNDLMHPIGDISNAGCRGWSVDVSFVIPVTKVR